MKSLAKQECAIAGDDMVCKRCMYANLILLRSPASSDPLPPTFARAWYRKTRVT